MTITEANAVNEIAREVVALAHGAVITPQLECGIATLLINAKRALGAGQRPETFLADLGRARADAARSLAKGYCKLCGGSGKVDRGNGSTKPCTCVAGLIESQRRKQKGASR